MKQFLLTSIIVVALIMIVFAVFRQPIEKAAYGKLTENMFVDADRDDFDPGPALGSRFPGLNGLYGEQPVTLLEPFAGPAGTVFMASRSFEWCPYCMKQMIELNRLADRFESAGIGLVAMTYDSPAEQARFASEHGITIPILADVDTLSFRTLGILNTEYLPGDDTYGIPFPGMIIVDPAGTVVGKLFLKTYTNRISAEAALEYATQVLGAGAPAAPGGH